MLVRRGMAILMISAGVLGAGLVSAAPAMARTPHYDCMVGATRLDRYETSRNAALEQGDTDTAQYWDDKAVAELAKYQAAGC